MAGTTTVAATGDDYIDGLIYGTKWTGQVWFDFPDNRLYSSGYGVGELDGFDFVHGNSYVVTLGIFYASSVGDGEGDNSVPYAFFYNNVRAFTQLDIDGPFGEDPSDRVADIRIASSSVGDPSGHAYSPGSFPGAVDHGEGGDIWFSADQSEPAYGNYAYLRHFQLIGTALGLKPAGEGGGVAAVAVPEDRNSLEYTVMSGRAYVGGPANGFADVGASSFPQTYMMLDIQALQELYGADYSYNNDNTRYWWDPDTGQMAINGRKLDGVPLDNTLFMTVWDGGGRDTYDFSSYTTPISVDLAPGGSTITSEAQRAYLGDGVYAKGSIYNALLFDDNPASLIENAISGSGDDTLRGNSANNVLNGSAGADVMIGLTGADSYVVDDLGDVIIEEAGGGTDIAYVRVSNYVLPAYVENGRIEEGLGTLKLSGNERANVLTGNDVRNLLYGEAGADTLYGLNGADHLDGGAGADAMIGGFGNDTYIVDSYSDVVYEKPSEGIDTLWTSVSRGLDADFENIVLFGAATDAGGNGLDNIVSGNELDNNLYGGGGADSLYGHDGSDRLFGEDGNDYMTGGKGTDAYYGGAGYDYAILEKGGGVDYFVDWNVTRDRVVFDSDIFPSIGAAMSAAFQNGTDVVIWDGADGIVLQSARLADLTTSNFLIV